MEFLCNITRSVKRLVWRWDRAGGDTSLLLDTTSYFNVAKEKNPNITMFYVSSNEVKTETIKTDHKFSKSLSP